jgi:hypothetical protein
MTSMPDLNITGSPIYEDLVAVSGDPYQPPAFQLPDVYGGGYVEAMPASAGSLSAPAAGPTAFAMQAAPEALVQWLGQFLGTGNWFAVLIFGGGAADQFQRAMAPAQYQEPGYSGYDAASQYSPEQIYQAYQWYAAQQQAQAALEARTPAALPPAPEAYPAATQYIQPQQQPPAALPAPALPFGQMPPQMQQPMQQMSQMQQMPVAASYGADATMQYSGLTDDWAEWLGRASQTVNPQMQEVGAPDYDEERRGIGGRFGAALRELRGR